ncbi:MAG: sulfatase-like hydrolase/transferase [Candidatus Nanohaloarchaea archaeon]
MVLEGKNIVLVVADTLSAFHLPFHGHERETAPFLSGLSEEYTYVEYGYANAPWTVPAHASMFSGELPRDHGTTSRSMRFTEDSFVEELSREGCFTLGVSTNSLLNDTLGFDRGFDSYVSSKEGVVFRNRGWDALEQARDSDAEGLEKYLEFGKKALRERSPRSFVRGLKYFFSGSKFGGPDSLFEDFGAKDANGLVLDELEGKDDFFAFVNYMEVHSPWVPPREFADKYVDDYESAVEVPLEMDFWSETFQEGVDEEKVDVCRDLYDASIRYLDSCIEELYNSVMEKDGDTVFIITSDHGELIGDYGWWNHQFGIWEKLLRVPIIIAGDGVPDTVIEENVSLRELHDLILGEKEIDELGSDRVFAEYHGAEAFILDFSDRSRDEFPGEAGPFLENESRCVIEGRKGLIRNSEFPDFTFEAGEKGFSEEDAGLELPDLEALLDREFGPVSGIDV